VTEAEDQWRAECHLCLESATGPTDWAVEDWADSHEERRPGHPVNVFRVGASND
jgi:hypothetical protein